MLSQKAQKMMDSLLLSCKGQYPAIISKNTKLESATMHTHMIDHVLI
jgi:hypothetical protein